MQNYNTKTGGNRQSKSSKKHGRRRVPVNNEAALRQSGNRAEKRTDATGRNSDQDGIRARCEALLTKFGKKPEIKHPNETLEAALRLHGLPWSIIPIKTDGSKSAAVSWAKYQSDYATIADLLNWFDLPNPYGIGVIHGILSGGSEVIDVDDPALVEAFEQRLEKTAPGLLSKLIIVRTPRDGGGRHYYYNFDHSGFFNADKPSEDGNQKLAERETPTEGVKTLIETRGRGGYTIAPGSPAKTHQTGRPYTPVQGDFTEERVEAARISFDERATLLEVAHSFNEWVNPKKLISIPRTAKRQDGDIRPGEAFDQSPEAFATVRAILGKHGWQWFSDDSHGELWTRPGKRSGISARLFDNGVFYVFSSNAHPFEPGQAYTPFGVLIELEHNGDASACARALYAEGFGEKPKKSNNSKAQQGENKYIAESSGLIWEKPTGEKVPLCNFVAEITGEVIRDDGTEQTDVYEITSTLNGVPKVGTVAASEFSSLKWVNKLLGARARVYPNREKYVGDAIRALSENIKTRIVVAHTGWRNDGDEWKYFHAGGAITASGLIEAEVSLPVQLENFVLVTPPDDAQLSADVRAIFDDLLKVTPNKPDVMVAGVGEVLSSVFTKPDFSGFDFGTTGTRKSQVQALKQSFFGRKYTDENLPESWRSSEYALETFASKIKDASGCIDEFKPEGTGTAREKWHTKADYVLRGAANKQGRSTLKADRTERPPRIPQGLLFCSGEELPIGESLRARLSIKEYDEKTVDLARLTTAQKQSADGLYVRVMSAFIQWLATDRRIEKLRDQRDEEIQRRRQDWLHAGVNSHGRTANNNAHLEWAWDTFFAFVADRKLIGDDGLKEYRKLVFSALDTHGRNQARYLITANDALKFVEFIQNAILSGKAHLTDLKGEEPVNSEQWGWKRTSREFGNQPQGVCIGAIDGDEVYLLPDESYRIAEASGTGTDRLKATKDALQKRLREEGLLARTTEDAKNPKNNKNTIQKRVKGVRAWMLCFKASTFIGMGADDDTAPDAAIPFNDETEQADNAVFGKFPRLSGVK